MLRRAAEAGRRASSSILGVTVLTSLARRTCAPTASSGTVAEMVRARAPRGGARPGSPGWSARRTRSSARPRRGARTCCWWCPGVRPAGRGARAIRSGWPRRRQAIARGRRLPGGGPPGARRGRPGRGLRGHRPRDRRVRSCERPATGGWSSASARSRSCVRARPRDVAVVYVADGLKPAGEIDRGDRRGQGSRHRGRVPPAATGRRAGRQGRRPPGHRGGGGRVPLRHASSDLLAGGRPRRSSRPLIMLLDGITDPHNLGALVRSAEVLGGARRDHPRARRGPGDRGGGEGVGRRHRTHAHRAGAATCCAPSTICASAGVRVLGAAAGSGERLDQVDLRGPAALVLGSEGRGIARGGGAALRRPVPHSAARRGGLAERLGRRRAAAVRGDAPAAARQARIASLSAGRRPSRLRTRARQSGAEGGDAVGQGLEGGLVHVEIAAHLDLDGVDSPRRAAVVGGDESALVGLVEGDGEAGA